MADHWKTHNRKRAALTRDLNIAEGQRARLSKQTKLQTEECTRIRRLENQERVKYDKHVENRVRACVAKCEGLTNQLKELNRRIKYIHDQIAIHQKNAPFSDRNFATVAGKLERELRDIEVRKVSLLRAAENCVGECERLRDRLQRNTPANLDRILRNARDCEEKARVLKGQLQLAEDKRYIADRAIAEFDAGLIQFMSDVESLERDIKSLRTNPDPKEKKRLRERSERLAQIKRQMGYGRRRRPRG